MSGGGDLSKISVSVRVRPLNERERRTGQSEVWRCNGKSIFQCNASGRPLPSCTYTFDNIYEHDATSEQVYVDTAQGIVRAACEGFNGTIFAYGQTSSGKTFTMYGSAEQKGVIPLAVEETFDLISSNPNREFLLRVSFLEIYNEIIRDLLSSTGDSLKIHEDLERGVFVGDLTEEVVMCPEQVYELMKQGEERRHVGATSMNERSSRSHTIFSITIESREIGEDSAVDGAVRVSTLHLVDLAGSERVSQTGAEGIRLREGGAINKSLLTLGTVICKLSDGNSSHIPYRDSKLTRILQPALGGNSKTAIIANITPAAMHCEETHSTLKFASRAKKISNSAQVNEIVDDKTMLRRLQLEIQELKLKLQQTTGPESLVASQVQERIRDLEVERQAEVEEKEVMRNKLKNMERLLLHGAPESTLHEAVVERKNRRRKERRRHTCVINQGALLLDGQSPASGSSVFCFSPGSVSSHHSEPSMSSNRRLSHLETIQELLASHTALTTVMGRQGICDKSRGSLAEGQMAVDKEQWESLHEHNAFLESENSDLREKLIGAQSVLEQIDQHYRGQVQEVEERASRELEEEKRNVLLLQEEIDSMRLVNEELSVKMDMLQLEKEDVVSSLNSAKSHIEELEGLLAGAEEDHLKDGDSEMQRHFHAALEDAEAEFQAKAAEVLELQVQNTELEGRMADVQEKHQEEVEQLRNMIEELRLEMASLMEEDERLENPIQVSVELKVDSERVEELQQALQQTQQQVQSLKNELDEQHSVSIECPIVVEVVDSQQLESVTAHLQATCQHVEYLKEQLSQQQQSNEALEFSLAEAQAELLALQETSTSIELPITVMVSGEDEETLRRQLQDLQQQPPVVQEIRFELPIELRIEETCNQKMVEKLQQELAEARELATAAKAAVDDISQPPLEDQSELVEALQEDLEKYLQELEEERSLRQELEANLQQLQLEMECQKMETNQQKEKEEEDSRSSLAELRTAELKVSRLEEENLKLQAAVSDLSSQSQTIPALREQIESLELERVSMNRKICQLQAELSNSQAGSSSVNSNGKIQQLENQLAEKEKVLTASSSRVKDLEETLAKLSSDSSKGEGELQESVKRLQTRVNALERDLDLKERDVHRLEQDKKTLEEKLADTGESSSSSFFGVRSESDAALKKRVEQLELKLDLTEQERDKAKEELKRKLHELEHLTLRAENESTRTGASASSLQQQVEESQDLVKRLKATVSSLENENSALASKIKGLQADLAEVQQQGTASTEHAQQTQAQMQEARKEQERLQDAVKNLELALERVRKELQEVQEEKDSLRLGCDASEREVMEIQSALEKAKADLEEAKGQKLEFANQASEKVKKVMELESVVQHLERENASMKKRLDSSASDIEREKERMKTKVEQESEKSRDAARQLSELQAEMRALRASEKRASSESDRLKGEREKVDMKIKELKERLQVASREKVDTQNEMRRQEREMKALKQQLARLEKQNGTLQDKDTRTKELQRDLVEAEKQVRELQGDLEQRMQQFDEVAHQEAEMRSELAAANERLEQLVRTNQELTSIVEELQEIRKSQEEALLQVRGDLEEAVVERDTLRTECSELSGALELERTIAGEMNNNLIDAKKKLELATAKIQSTEDQAEGALQAARENRDELNLKSARVSELEAELLRVKESLQKSESQCSALAEAIAEQEFKGAELQEKMDAEREEWDDKESDMNAQIIRLEQELEQALEELTTCKQDLVDMQAVKEEMNSLLEESEAAVEHYEKENEMLQEELKCLTENLEMSEDKLKQMESMQSKLQVFQRHFTATHSSLKDDLGALSSTMGEYTKPMMEDFSSLSTALRDLIQCSEEEMKEMEQRLEEVERDRDAVHAMDARLEGMEGDPKRVEHLEQEVAVLEQKLRDITSGNTKEIEAENRALKEENNLQKGTVHRLTKENWKLQKRLEKEKRQFQEYISNEACASASKMVLGTPRVKAGDEDREKENGGSAPFVASSAASRTSKHHHETRDAPAKLASLRSGIQRSLQQNSGSR